MRWWEHLYVLIRNTSIRTALCATPAEVTRRRCGAWAGLRLLQRSERCALLGAAGDSTTW